MHCLPTNLINCLGSESFAVQPSPFYVTLLFTRTSCHYFIHLMRPQPSLMRSQAWSPKRRLDFKLVNHSSVIYYLCHTIFLACGVVFAVNNCKEIKYIAALETLDQHYHHCSTSNCKVAHFHQLYHKSSGLECNYVILLSRLL